MPVYNWSTTAASNATADSAINWAEGMAPSAVNDSARAEMAAVAKWRNDHASMAHTTGGTSTAYTLRTDSVFDTLAHLDKQMLVFVPHATSGASPTLAVDGLAAKAINGPASATAIPTGALVIGIPYAVMYDNSNNQFILLNYRDTLLNATVTGTLAVTGAATFSGGIGAPTATTQANNDNSTKVATTAYVTSSVAAIYAPLASPALTGTPTAPTASAGDNSTKIATTAYADNAAKTEGGRTLLATYTINAGDASVTDTTNITSSYKNYDIELENVVPTSASKFLELQLHSNSAYQNSGYLAIISYAASSSPSALAGDAPTTFFPVTGQGAVIATTAGLGASGVIRIINPSQTSNPKHVIAHTSWDSGGNWCWGTATGVWNGGNTAIDGFKLLMNSGTLASGTVRLYGLS